MGSRMILYEIDRDQWWDFIEKVNKLYKEESWQMTAFEELKKTNIGAAIDFTAKEEMWVDFQVFEEGGGYFFRVLEAGYFFMNNFHRFPELTLHFYDNHSDIPPEMEKEIIWLEWMDKKIREHQYMIYPVINSDVFKF